MNQSKTRGSTQDSRLNIEDKTKLPEFNQIISNPQFFDSKKLQFTKFKIGDSQ